MTTGNGPDGRAPVMWRKADAGEGRYMASFLPWYVHPERDDDWYQLNVLEAPEPRLAHREFAATPEEAFASPEGVFFERWDPRVNTPGADPAAAQLGDLAGGRLRLSLAGLPVDSDSRRSGQFVVVAELAQREPFNWTTEEFADEILEIDASLGLFEPPRGTFCDPAGKARQSADRRDRVRGLSSSRAWGRSAVSLVDPRRLRAHHRRHLRPRPAAAGEPRPAPG